MRFTILVALFAFTTSTLFAGKLPDGVARPSTQASVSKKARLGSEVGNDNEPPTALESLKMRKRFGLGVTAGGGLAIMGLEVDINITPSVSASIGWGTGVDYSSFGVRARYFLLGEWVSPFIGLGFAHWWGGPNANRDMSPAVLRNKFLDGVDLTQGYNVFILYPSIGVQWMHHMGFAVSFEVMQMFKLMNLANGTYAGASFHWYF